MAKKKKSPAPAGQRQPESRKNGYIFQLCALGAVIVLAGYLLVSGFAGDAGDRSGEASTTDERSSFNNGELNPPLTVSDTGPADEGSGRQVLEAVPAERLLDKLPTAPITVEPRILHFGEVARNTIVTGEVTLTNTGTSPVRIVDARPSCPCTKTSRPANSINPGQSLTVEVQMDTEAKLGLKTVTVHILLAGYDRVRIPIQAVVQ